MVSPSKKAIGRRDPHRKTEPVHLTPEEVERIVSRLPERTSRPRGAGEPLRRLRDIVCFEWDTTLRPSTIERLSVPEHWKPGATKLHITKDIDKNRFQRDLPLPPRALAILERCAPEVGIIFGPYQRALREPLKAAARAVGLDERRANKISVYDLRHAAAKRYLDASGNQRGVSFLLGQTQPTTLNRHTRPDELAAHDVLTKALAVRPSG